MAFFLLAAQEAKEKQNTVWNEQEGAHMSKRRSAYEIFFQVSW